MIKGFKDFISRGNALELAVGVVIAAAFGKVVDSIVNGLINPFIAGVIGKPNFDDVLAFKLGTATLRPGLIITALVNFILIALAVYFLIVVPMNKMNELAKRKKNIEDPSPAEPTDVELLVEIRDLLRTSAESRQVGTAGDRTASLAAPTDAVSEDAAHVNPSAIVDGPSRA